MTQNTTFCPFFHPPQVSMFDMTILLHNFNHIKHYCLHMHTTIFTWQESWFLKLSLVIVVDTWHSELVFMLDFSHSIYHFSFIIAKCLIIYLHNKSKSNKTSKYISTLELSKFQNCP